MSIDIIIFAAIAAFLIYRLRSVLGERHGDEQMRQNPYAENQPLPGQHEDPVPSPALQQSREDIAESMSLTAADIVAEKNGGPDEMVLSGLTDITLADTRFDAIDFVKGAKAAFKMIVMAYAHGERETLEMLLSPKLYQDFEAGIKAREQAGQSLEVDIDRVKDAKILDARLGGTMAYITVDFKVEETKILKDKNGNVVEGDPERISEIEDIWTFARDTRSDDPNWMLIETRASKD